MTVRLAAILVMIPLMATGGQLPQAPGPLRRDITVVPVDARVFDRNGRPVTDLTRDDFIVSENGVPEAIQHFSVQALEAEPAQVAAEPIHRGASGEAPAPRNRRLFLLMLGRVVLASPERPRGVHQDAAAAEARQLKIVVYDYGSDLLGTATARLPGR
jgi:hypothetical protein